MAISCNQFKKYGVSLYISHPQINTFWSNQDLMGTNNDKELCGCTQITNQYAEQDLEIATLVLPFFFSYSNLIYIFLIVMSGLN